jgi:hypothetical protein
MRRLLALLWLKPQLLMQSSSFFMHATVQTKIRRRPWRLAATTTLSVQPNGEHCKGMEGVIKEGADALEKDEDGASFDSGVIGAALRTEQYEIAGYTAIIAMANTLKMSGVVALLQQSLKEEENAAKRVILVSQAILKESAAEPESRKGPKSEKVKYSDKKCKEDEKNAAPAMAKHRHRFHSL